MVVVKEVSYSFRIYQEMTIEGTATNLNEFAITSLHWRSNLHRSLKGFSVEL